MPGTLQELVDMMAQAAIDGCAKVLAEDNLFSREEREHMVGIIMTRARDIALAKATKRLAKKLGRSF